MKKTFIFTYFILFLFSCENEPIFNPVLYNPNLTISQNLNNGVPVLEILQENDINSFYGVYYGGGYVFHVNESSGELIVATDYSEIGDVAWGDVFELDTSFLVGEGDINTELIIQGNEIDNSSNGTEFGSDDYAFKIVSDLTHSGYNDWFIPTSDSMAAIYLNVHSIGLGDFDESLIYWSSTKEGYFPYVMAFNFESWGGLPLPGSCLEVNGLLIARKIQ